MKIRQLLAAPLTVALLGFSAAALAAPPADNDASTMQNGPAGMGGAMHENAPPRRGHMARGEMRGGGMMRDGMMGMMGACPMMGGESGVNRKVLMQMHGEMMRAMGDIMIKYADKFETPPPAQ